MKKSSLNATSLRGLLAFLIVLLIGGVAAGFYWGLQQVRTFAVEVNHTTADAAASGDSIKKLQDLKSALAERQALVNKANQVYTTEANYQTQALKDVQKYAATYGITISSTSFNNDPPNNGVHTFIIRLQQPVDYMNLLKFLSALESSLPNMQVSNMEIGRPSSGDVATKVTTGDITIEISTR